MSKDFLQYQFEQEVGEQLKGILTAKDLANMVITVKIEFNNNEDFEREKREKEAEERARYNNERNNKKANFRMEWGGGANDRARRRRKGEIDNAWIKRARVELYEKYFPGEKEEDFLLHLKR